MIAMQGIAAVVGGILLNLAFGGLYAFSVMVPALESTGAMTRADTAMVFALSTSSFMTGVWACSRVWRYRSAHAVSALAGIGAAAGLLLCAWQASLGVLVVGYSGIYGFCAGIGYALSLASLAQVTLKYPGRATGIVVAAFAAGSVCWAQGFRRAIDQVGVPATLLYSAGAVVTLAMAAAVALWFAKAGNPARQPDSPARREHEPHVHAAGRSQVSALTLWLVFFGVASAGLTVIGQALQIIGSHELDVFVGVSIVALAGGANGIGRLIGGAVADRSSSWVLLGLPLVLTVAALTLLLVGGSPASAYFAVLTIASMYGWCSAAIPVAVLINYGEQRFSEVYGRVFTAWGAAGLIAPWASGWAYAHQGHYKSSFAALALVSLIAIASLGLQRRRLHVITPSDKPELRV